MSDAGDIISGCFPVYSITKDIVETSPRHAAWTPRTPFPRGRYRLSRYLDPGMEAVGVRGRAKAPVQSPTADGG
jgi:hypothetical protein